jgi:hypothetical protein
VRQAEPERTVHYGMKANCLENCFLAWKTCCTPCCWKQKHPWRCNEGSVEWGSREIDAGEPGAVGGK